jgi:hypothetical protein
MSLMGVDVRERRLTDGRNSVGFTDTAPVTLQEVMGRGEEVARPLLIQIMAGPLAEERINPSTFHTDGQDDDVSQVHRVAVAACCEPLVHPDGTTSFSAGEQRRSGARINELKRSANEEATRLVTDHWGAIERVADRLLERGSLSGTEVAEIVGGRSPDLPGGATPIR